MSDSPLVVPNPWDRLRRFTPARLALGRAGTSLPTADHLAFQLDHARACDAVHSALDVKAVEAKLKALGLATVSVRSGAQDRQTYLRRPDLGRRLDGASRERLAGAAASPPDIALAVVDGLSALAVERHAATFLEAFLPRARAEGLTLGPAVVALQGRVALGDEIGEVLGASLVVVLIGERPGLSSPDSMGLYMTYAPRVGRTDAERNCISNIRDEGLSPKVAANTLIMLLREARRRRLSGVLLKDETERDGGTIAEDPASGARPA